MQAPSAKPGRLPDEIFQALQEKHNLEESDRARRRYDRKPWITCLILHIEEGDGSAVTTRQVDITTHDLSRGGFGFIFKNYLPPGTKIRAQFDGLESRPTVSAVVRNCQHLLGSSYAVGAEFTGDSAELKQ